MNPADIEQFHNDLKSALLAEIPLEDDQRTRLTLQHLTDLQQQFKSSSHDSRHSSNGASQSEGQSSLPDWYRAALTLFARTGSTVPVLEGLSARPSAVREVYRVVRWTIFYVLIVVSMVIVGLFLHQLLIVPHIEYLRADLVLPSAADTKARIDILPWLPGLIVVLACVFIFTLNWVRKGGITNRSSWLGCQDYINGAISATVVQISKTLVSAGLAVDEALSVGFSLTGADTNVRRDVRSVVLESDDAIIIGQMADYLMVISARRLAHLRIVTPILMTATVGGGLVLIYCLIMFWPIISLLRDLPMVGD